MDIRTLVYMWTSLLLSIFPHSATAHGNQGYSRRVFFHTITLYLGLFGWWGPHLDVTSESRRCSNMYLKNSWTKFSRQLQNKDAINDSASCQPLCIPEMIGHVVQWKGANLRKQKYLSQRNVLALSMELIVLKLFIYAFSVKWKKQAFFPFFPVYKRA